MTLTVRRVNPVSSKQDVNYSSPVLVTLDDLFVRRFGERSPSTFDPTRDPDVDDLHEHVEF